MQENRNTIDRDHLIFPVQLHLKPYVEHWRTHVAPDRARISAETVAMIEQTLQDHPFLLEPSCDPAVFAPFRTILNVLFAPMFPAQDMHSTMQALSPPFYHKHVIVATPLYERIFNDPQAEFRILDNSEYGAIIDYRVLYAYKFILKKFYDLDIKVDQPIVASLLNPEKGLRRYFKLTGTTQFLQVTCQGELPVVDHQILQQLLDQKYSAETWGAVIPPEKFVFSGLSTITLVDITIEHATSNLQAMLYNRPGLEEGWLTRVSEEMRNLFRLPRLRLGLAAMQANGKMNFTSLHPLWNSLLIKEVGVDPTEYVHSAYQEVQDTEQNLIIEDL